MVFGLHFEFVSFKEHVGALVRNAQSPGKVPPTLLLIHIVRTAAWFSLINFYFGKIFG